MIPILSGPVIKRPGTNYIGEAKHSTAVFIPFFKDKDNTYIIELGSTSPSSGGYLRVWSQNQLLNDNTTDSTTPYEYSTVFPWTAAELSTLKTTQSGDIIFVCCPTKPPQKIFRTLSDATTSAVADDNSVWAITEFVTTDGPYTEINIWDESDATKRFTLKLTPEPTTTKEIGSVEFNTIDNTLVLANHGLQVGQKIKLNGSSGTGWGNIRQNISGKTSTDGKAQSKMDGSNSIAIASTACTITASSASIAGTNTLKPNNIITLTGTFASVTGFATSTNYYVSSTGLTESTFQLKASVDGAVITPGGSSTATPNFVGALGGDTFNLDAHVIATTSTTIQFSDTDGGKIREFELVQTDEDDPATTASNAEVKLEKYVFEASSTSDRVLTLYNDNNIGSQTITTTYFSANDIGRLIRINPLLKGGSNIGGIKWAWGIIKDVDNTGTNGTIDVEFKSEMANSRGSYGTAEFRTGAFSLGEGYPHVAQIYQQRMVLAATSVQPSTIWLSETANFYSFAPTVISEQGSPDSVTEGVSTEIIIDSNALTFTLDSDTLDEIKWLGESKKLSMGTSAGIYMLYGSETNLSITPFRFTINRETSFSATDTAPVIVSNALLYTQIGGKDVQSLELEGDTVSQWISSKISLKGYDIIKDSTIEKMIWQERPFAIIWFMMANGKLLSLSYDRSLEFKAWSEHVIAGKIYRKVTATVQATADRVFTASTSSGLLLTDTVGTHGLLNGKIIQVTTTGTLPTGLSLSTNYYVVNKTANTFKLATTSNGSAIAFTDVGSGTHSWHKPSIYTVAGDQTSMFVVDKYAIVSNYADSNWNVSQEIINVLHTGGNTEITTRLDSSSFASTTSTNPIIEADGSSHAQVTDIDMIPTATHDQVWFKVKRTINGTDVYHVETLGRFPTEGALDRNAFVFSDSAVTGAVPASKIITGLKHLRNEEVQVYYEGMQHSNLTVTDTGGSDETITLTHTEGNEHVTGLAYDAEMETLAPSAPENQFSYTKRLIKVAVLVEESLGIQLEYNDLSEELLFRTTQDAMGRQIPLFSGLRKLSLSGIGWETHNLKIVSNGPFPMQLNAVIIEADTGGS